MSEFTEISPQQAWQMLQENEQAVLADVRRADHFAQAHLAGAVNLTEQTWQQFSQHYEYDQPIIVSCYHGISSRTIATFLAQQGYEQIYSVIGGFEAWQQAGYPMVSDLAK